MGLFTRDIKTINDLFVHQLQDTYYAGMNTQPTRS